MATATVTLANDGTINITAPQPGYTSRVVRAQAQGRAAAGYLYVYDKTVGHYETDLVFKLSKSEMQALRTFVESDIVFGLNTFTYTDHLGVAHTEVKLLQTIFDAGKTEGALYVIPFSVETLEALD